MGTPLGPKYIPYTYMDPLGKAGLEGLVCWSLGLRAPPDIHAITGIMEKKMETTIVYWGYIGIMEKNMETTFTCPLTVAS